MKKPELAFWLETPSIAACEIAQLVGYGIVVIDMEHGTIGTETCDNIVAFCRALKLTCYVRVAAADRLLIQQALDYGASGVLLPQITDAAHAAEVCAYAKYPPLGSRGVGYSRAMSYGAYDNTDDQFFAGENRRTVCHPMIETPGALRDVEAIVELKTVDGIFIGPSDLSMTRGRGAFRFTAEDQADFRAVAAAARKAEKMLGLPAPGAAVYRLAAEEGAGYVTVSDDLTALRLGLTRGLEVARSSG
ncbi:MAG: aldolase/citrate lyase family protein [Pseudomonadota bacterium]|nr:aldolase/citrate lyase family protein [Pseudomonadota bacterium]